jgi:hypothetical protein
VEKPVGNAVFAGEEGVSERGNAHLSFGGSSTLDAGDHTLKHGGTHTYAGIKELKQKENMPFRFGLTYLRTLITDFNKEA